MQSSETKVQMYISICDPLMCTMNHPRFIVIVSNQTVDLDEAQGSCDQLCADLVLPFPLLIVQLQSLTRMLSYANYSGYIVIGSF